MNNLLNEYKQLHPNLSGEMERELKRFVDWADDNCLVLSARKCYCGTMFLPSATNSTKCINHVSLNA